MQQRTRCDLLHTCNNVNLKVLHSYDNGCLTLNTESMLNKSAAKKVVKVNSGRQTTTITELNSTQVHVYTSTTRPVYYCA